MTGPISDIYALTSAQAGLVMSSLAETEPGLYVVQMRFALSGHLESAALERAWQALTLRHDVLRTAIVWEKTSRPVNVVMTDATMPVSWLDLSDLNAAARHDTVQRFLTDDRRRGFDLQRAPLSRVTVLSFGDDEWEMVWTHNHVILDGWSAALLVDELWRSYADHTPPAQPPRFRDFAANLAAATERNRSLNQAYWGKRLIGGAERLPADRPGAASTPGIWTDRALDVSPTRLETWHGAARRHGTTLSTLYHAGWALALRAGGLGANELVLGTVVDTRGIDAANVIGLCIASVPMRVDFPSTAVGQWLRSVAVERANSHEHATVNLAEHRTWSEDSAGVPFRYLLAVEGYPHASMTSPDAGPGLVVRYLGVHESTEYALTAGVPAGAPRLKLTFDTRRIADGTAVALLEQWATALDRLAAVSSEAPLTDVLAAAPPPSSSPTLPQRISELAVKHPDRPAFRDAVCSLQLGELDVAAARVGAALRIRGLLPGQRVGVLVDDAVVVAIAMLGTLAAGGVVVPLDPRHPQPYRKAVLATGQVSRVLTSRPDARPEWEGVEVHTVSELLADAPAAPQRTALGWGPAFLIADSGSAAHPVATAHDHASVVETATSMGIALGLRPGDEWLVTRPATGAAAPAEMWAAPLSGGCTVLAPGVQHDPAELSRLIDGGTVTVIGVTEAETRDLDTALGQMRGRLVTATRVDNTLTLWSASGDRLAAIGEAGRGPVPAREFTVDGVPVDPAHLEGLLLGQPDVTSCAVRQEPDGTLLAVVGTTQTCMSFRDLTRVLRSSLPETMVPRLVREQAVALPSLRQREIESEVAQLWSEVLGRHDVPADTPFFDLGGHSLLLFAVLRGLKTRGWPNVEITDLLAHPTVRTLSGRLGRPDPPQAVLPPARSQHRRGVMAARRERGRT